MKTARSTQPLKDHRTHKPINRTSSNLPLLVFVGGVIGIVTLMLIFSSSTSSKGVPDFTVPTLHGETVRVSDFKGQVVMLNFWATWCPPCKAEMPAIQAAYKQYHDQGFNVLAINNGETVAQVQPFASTLALSFPIGLDTDASLQRTFAIKGYPTSIFISGAGEVYATHTGMLTAQQLDGYISTGLETLKANGAA